MKLSYIEITFVFNFYKISFLFQKIKNFANNFYAIVTEKLHFALQKTLQATNPKTWISWENFLKKFQTLKILLDKHGVFILANK